MSCSTPAEKQASLIVPSDAEPRVLSDLSELIDSMTYIPLEINDDCVLGHVQTARMCDDRILVKDDKGFDYVSQYKINHRFYGYCQNA